jgi:D-lactate dehydrogenase
VELEKSRDRADRKLAKQLDEEYVYYGVDTCSVDGMCAMACPVNIDTGRVVKEIRARKRSRLQHFLADRAVSHFAFLTRIIRASIGVTVAVEKLLGKGFVVFMTKVGSALSFRALPSLSKEIPVPRPAPELPEPDGTGHDRTVVYFPSCLTRTLGAIPGEKPGDGLAATLLYILGEGGWNAVYPKGLRGLCCGQPFSSKGFVAAAEKMASRLIRALWDATDEGKHPIMCDTSPCSGQIMRAGENLMEPELGMWRKLKIYDMPTFLVRFVLPEIENLEPLPVNAVLHPTCTIMKIGAHKDLVRAAEMCATKVTVPVMAECCGFAGDRGFRHPELTLSATAQEAKEVQEYARCEPNSLFLSTCRTCEVGVTAGSGLPYQSLAYLVADAIRKSNNGDGKPDRD